MSKRILVVEDQPDSRQIIRDMLAGTDYEITEAENGEAGTDGYNETAPRPDPDGHSTADYGRLHSDQPNQG